MTYRKVTADADNILTTDYVVSVANGNVEWDIFLPDATTCLGKIYIIKKYDENSTAKIYIQSLGGLVQINETGSFGIVQPLPAVWAIATYYKKFQSNGTDWEAI